MIVRFFVADVNIFLLVNYIMAVLPDKYFKTVFWVANPAWQFASITSWAWRFFEQSYFTGWCSNMFKVGGIFKYDFITNLLPSLTVKELWKLVSIWWSCGQECAVLFFLTHSVVYCGSVESCCSIALAMIMFVMWFQCLWTVVVMRRRSNCETWSHPLTTLSSTWINSLSVLYCIGWLGSRVVSVLDSGAEGPGFKLQPRRCRVTVLGKLFTPIVPLFTKQRNW